MLQVIYSFHGLFNEIIREVAEEENIGLIDLNKQVPAKSHKYIYDVFHYNTAGSELVAGIITDRLFELISSPVTDSLQTNLH